MTFARDEPGGASLDVKAVPGAKRDQIVGRLGDRLKIRVSQPPENGRANRALIALLAHELGVKPAAITLLRGQSGPEKSFRIAGVSAAALESRWPG